MDDKLLDEKNRIHTDDSFFEKLIYWEKMELNLCEKRLEIVSCIKIFVYIPSLYLFFKIGYSCHPASSHHLKKSVRQIPSKKLDF